MRLQTPFRCIAALLLGLISAVSAAADGPVIRDQDSSAVITLPEAWSLRKMDGVKNQIGVGKTYGDFAVNIYVTSEIFSGTWKEFQKSNLELIEMMYREFKLMSQDVITSDHGVPLVRIVARSNLKRNLQQFFYYGPGQGQSFFTVICTVPLEQGSQYAEVFDALAQQIRVEGDHIQDPSEEVEPQVTTSVMEMSPHPEEQDTER